ncbi:MAG: phosphodiesterase [Planctomycetia bacterium]|nr:phosphodiesterase [Planctomycetia bacterium]
MTTHRVVQITDCHLFADPAQALRGIVTWPRFVAVLEDVRQQVPDADLLVITGDTAHDEARATYEAVREALTDWTGRVRIIPGNHDNRADLRELFPTAQDGPAGRVTFSETWDEWQVIGLDSQRPGELAGSLGDEQLEWLQSCLRATAQLPTLLFLHHSPIPVQSPWLDRIGLQDAAAFERILRDHLHVRLICCGHVHQEVVGSLGGAATFTTPAVGPPFRPRTEQLEIDSAPPGYRVLELQADGRWSTQVLRAASQSALPGS